MRDVKLMITPFKLIEIIECTIHKEVNQHFTAKIVGHIPPTDNDEMVQRCPKDQAVCIRTVDETGEETVFFKGIVRQISFKNVGGFRTLTVEAVSRTWLMDVKEHTRTFQYEPQTYRDVAEFIKKKNHAAFIYTQGIKERANEIIVQYEETDWEFLKRIASQINTVVVADEENDNIAMCFGIPEKRTKYQAMSSVYAVGKMVDEYTNKKEYNVNGIGEADAIEYIFKEREIWELCAPVTFLDNKLYVHKIITNYDGKELVHTYHLRTKEGFKTKRQNNHKLSGCSLNGTVIDVTNNFVKMHCEVDEAQLVPTAKWFDYSTVYSHPIGTGWYCMPEIGDAVRLYFPNEWERTGYAISAVHRDNLSQRRMDPNSKTLCTIHNKEIEFTPETIRITNNKGMTILLDDHKGITLVSNKDIELHSGKNIKITGMKNVEIHGKNGVDLKQRSNQINISDSIREWGEGVYHK